MDAIPETESRRALGELIEVVREADERWISPEWNLHTKTGAIQCCPPSRPVVSDSTSEEKGRSHHG